MLQRILTFAAGFGLLAGLSAAGFWASSRLPLGLPGAIIGLIAYVALLLAVPRAAQLTQEAAEMLLKWLGLLITPAAVGLALHADRLASEAGRLAIVIVASTVITGFATLAAYRGLRKWLS